MNALVIPRMTLEDDLAWEDGQEERHEFHCGEVFAMVGARRVHGRVVGNLHRFLHVELHGSPCQVFAESTKLQVADRVLYPDLFVTCDAADLRTDILFRSPTVVIEVLSPSTEGYVRGLEFSLDRGIATLRKYVLVDPDLRRVEVFRRDDTGQWLFHEVAADAALELSSIDCRDGHLRRHGSRWRSGCLT